MQRFSSLAICFLFSASSATGAIWTETFGNGVGRFDITTGQGETAFAHDPIDGDLNATFVRRDVVTEPAPDRRLADLGQVFTQAHLAAFSVEWTPNEASSVAWPLIGFFDTTSAADVAVIRVDTSPHRYELTAAGIAINPAFATWDFGETYLLEFGLDGPNHTLTFASSVLMAGEFHSQGSGSWPFPEAEEYAFDSLGIGNILDNQGVGNNLLADIDNFSFLPEPSTVSLLALGGLAALRRRRR